MAPESVILVKEQARVGFPERIVPPVMGKENVRPVMVRAIILLAIK